jgi:UDP-glucose 4-epimerase
MRVVITGATGNVGTSVVDALAAEPQVTDIIGLSRRPTARVVPKTTWQAADVALDDLTPTFVGTDALVHLAWAFHPTRHPVETWRVNVLGTMRTVETAIAAGVRTVVYSSSVGAYSPGPPSGDRVSEDWPTHALPTAAYGREKSYLERWFDAAELRHPEVRFVRLRMAFVFQRRAAAEQRRIFAGPLVPGRVLRPGILPVLPLPRGLRIQAVHAADVAEAYRLALLGTARGAFNIAAEPVLDIHALADLLGSRAVPVPTSLVRGAHAAAWHARLVPAEPGLLQLALSLPVMGTGRGRAAPGGARPHRRSHPHPRRPRRGAPALAGADHRGGRQGLTPSRRRPRRRVGPRGSPISPAGRRGG